LEPDGRATMTTSLDIARSSSADGIRREDRYPMNAFGAWSDRGDSVYLRVDSSFFNGELASAGIDSLFFAKVSETGEITRPLPYIHHSLRPEQPEFAAEFRYVRR
jgi:hypothetical protein